MGRLVSLEIPAGASRNGTEYQNKGRWYDVNLVRWHEGSTKPHTGWSIWGGLADGTIAQADSLLSVGDPMGCMAWADNSENEYLVFADAAGDTRVVEADGTITGLTPSSPSGQSDWVHFDTFGEIPLMCLNKDGSIYEWDLDTGTDFVAVTNAPTDCIGVVVADERFILALKKRRVEWCDRDDRTVWTSGTDNQAGGFSLDTEGEIHFGLQMRGEVLIVGSKDAWAARYIGYPDVWEFRRIARASSVGGGCGVRVGDRAYWVGDESFYVYQGGYVEELPCDVWDYFTSNLPSYTDFYSTNRRRIFGWHNALYNEVVWQYQSAAGSFRDSYIAYNYVTGNWSYGSSPFSVVAERVPFTTALGVPTLDTNDHGFFDTFSVDQGWSLGTNWQISGGSLSQTSPAASAASISVTKSSADAPYSVVVDIANRTAGSVTVQFGETSSALSTNATHLVYLTSSSGPETLVVTADGTFDGEITYVLIQRAPVLAVDDGSYTYPWASAEPYAETGPIELGDGQNRVHVTRLLPDEQDAGELSLTFKTREYPTSSETTHGPYSASNPTSVRFSGRQFTMRVEAETAGTDWRSGVHRVEVTKGGRR